MSNASSMSTPQVCGDADKNIQHCQGQVAEVILVQSVLSPVSGFVIVRDIFTALGIVSNNNLCTVYS